MKKYIQFINENINIQSDQVLRDLYNKFNILYFNSELPDTLTIKWVRSKRCGGVVRCTYNSRTKTVLSIEYLCISNYRPLTDEKLNGLMLHEMIHVFLFHKNIVHTSGLDKTHGIEFKEKLKELEQTSGIVIPLMEESFDISDHIKSQNFDVLFYIVGKQILMSIFKFGYLEENKEDVIKKFEYTLSQKRKTSTVSVIALHSSERELLNYRCKRNIKTMTMYDIEKEMFDRIKNNSEILYEF